VFPGYRNRELSMRTFEKDIMKQEKQLLKETGDRSNFIVPENYFEDFKVGLNYRLDALEKEKKETKNKIGLLLTMEKVRPFLYVAAIFVFLLFSVALVLNITSDKSSSSLGLSVKSKSKAATYVPTAEDYLINSVGTYGITEYYIESENVD